MPGQEAIELNFLVTGSEPEPYRVSFKRIEGKFRAHCNCRAGEMSQLCKHRMALIAGDVTSLASPNAADVERLPALIAGTDVEALLRRLSEAEAQQNAIKREIAAYRRQLARILNT